MWCIHLKQNAISRVIQITDLLDSWFTILTNYLICRRELIMINYEISKREIQKEIQLSNYKIYNSNT